MSITDSLCVDNSQLNSESPSSSSIKPSRSAQSVAQSLDKKFNLRYSGPLNATKEVTSRDGKETIKNDSPRVSFKSPTVEKVWTPLSHSTPMGDDIQPKDLLKAKSKLSNLIQSIHDVDEDLNIKQSDEFDEKGKSDDDDDDDDEPTFDDTPSKVKVNSNNITLAPNQKKDLEDYKRLKEFISSISNGSSILESFEKNRDPSCITVENQNKQKEIENKLQSLEKANTSLKQENDTLNTNFCLLEKQVSYLNQENKTLKETSELSNEKDETISRLEQQNQELRQELDSKDKAETALQEKITLLNIKIGDPSSAILVQRFPTLATKYEYLDLYKIDLLSQIDAQNIVKNILINLNIPFDQIQNRVNEMKSVSRNENILYHFANQIHTLLYEEKLKLSGNQEQFLEQCTTQMFRSLEVLYHNMEE